MLNHKKYVKIVDFLKDQDQKSNEYILYEIIESLGLSNLFQAI